MISPKEWPAHDYAIGSYIQDTIASLYLANIKIKPTDVVLDIGCGNSSFSLKLLQHFSMQSLLGIDRSENMIELSRQTATAYKNVSFEVNDVTQMSYQNQFDHIVSFWCLQWVNNIHLVFENIARALKPQGNFFAIIPAGDDEFLSVFFKIKDSHEFSSLEQFNFPVDVEQLHNLEANTQNLPFKKFTIQRKHHQLLLPSIDIFQKFINGIPFLQGQKAESDIKKIQDAMVKTYENTCKNKYHGEYVFNMHIYCLIGQK